jgi:aspartate carbamoyltransferase catalytic subunit
VDSTPHAAYFRQAFLAVPVRMALLALVLTGKAP